MSVFKVKAQKVTFPPSREVDGNFRVLNTYLKETVSIVLFDGADLKLGKRFMAESLSQKVHPCVKDTDVRATYAVDVLQNIELTHIFIAFVSSDKEYKNLTGKKVIPMGFALCTTHDKFGLRFELNLTCSNKTQSSLNIGFMILLEMLKFFKKSEAFERGVRLYAIDWSLIFFYYKLGFVMVPLNNPHTCDIKQDYWEKWHLYMQKLNKEYTSLREKLKTLTEDRKTLELQKFERGKINELIRNLTPRGVSLYNLEDFYYSIEFEDETKDDYGYFMVFCPNLQFDRSTSGFAKESSKDDVYLQVKKFDLDQIELDLREKLETTASTTNWNSFWSNYQFEIDIQERDQIIEKIGLKPLSRSPFGF